LTAYFVLSPGTGFLAPVSRQRAKRVALGISTGMPGPHDLAVRIALFVGMETMLQHRHAHRILRSTSVTIAKRPSRRGRMAIEKHVF
jgi:hypothetical protein